MSVSEGYLLTQSIYGEQTERATYHCCHCQRAVIMMPGSGRQRGFCFHCMQPNCGRQKCVDTCMPWEHALEISERRAKLHRQLDET